MSNYVLLNPEEHRDLRVIDERSEKYGDGVMYAMTFPFEFRNVQSCYPIFFQKDANTGRFFPVALFGFQDNENLFLSEQGWDATYIPLMIKRQPFLIGYQSGEAEADKKNAKVTIDMDNPRISQNEGQSLFLEHGGSSEYLQEITKNLEMIHQAHEHGDAFVDALVEHELLEAFSLDVVLQDGSNNQLVGLYTINEDKVQELDASVLGEFNAQGFLQPIFMVIASHSCIRSLVDLKNATL